jgi:uncharacterized membrane protein
MKRDVTMNRRRVKTLIDGVLLALTIAYVFTGLGITHYRIIEAVTLGFLSKPVSFAIHEKLFVPFMLCLILHLLYGPLTKLARSSS